MDVPEGDLPDRGADQRLGETVLEAQPLGEVEAKRDSLDRGGFVPPQTGTASRTPARARTPTRKRSISAIA